MKNNSGFYLTETVIYIALSSLFFIILFNFTSNIYKQYKTISNRLNTQSWSAIDLISRDLQKTNKVFLCDKDIIIVSIGPTGHPEYPSKTGVSPVRPLDRARDKLRPWATSGREVAWKLLENKLYRTEGKYNIKNSKWESAITSLASYNVNLFECKQKSQLITIALQINNKKFTKDIFIRHRAIAYENKE